MCSVYSMCFNMALFACAFILYCMYVFAVLVFASYFVSSAPYNAL